MVRGDWFEVIAPDTDANARRRHSTETDYRTDYAVQRTCGLLGCTDRLVPVLASEERETAEMRVRQEHVTEVRVHRGTRPAPPHACYARGTFGTLRARLT